MIKPSDSPRARAVHEARHRVLAHLATNGPITVPEIPRRWPLTGHHIRLIVRDLSREGLLAVEPDGAVPLIVLTRAGREAAGAGPHDS